MIEMFDMVRKQAESPVKHKRDIKNNIDEDKEGEDDPALYDTLDDEHMRSAQTYPSGGLGFPRGEEHLQSPED
jgi:hypothetical protein